MSTLFDNTGNNSVVIKPGAANLWDNFTLDPNTGTVAINLTSTIPSSRQISIDPKGVNMNASSSFGKGIKGGKGFFSDIDWNKAQDAAASAGVNIIGNLAYGTSGRKTTKAGEALHTASQFLNMIPGIGTGLGALANIVGGFVNSRWGSYVNDAAVDAMKTRVHNYATNYSSPSSNEQLLQDFTTTGGMNFITNKDIDSEGPKATKITAELNDQISQANKGRISHMLAAANTLDSDYDRTMKANFSAFGGPITGAIDYSNMMDYTALKRKQIDKGLQYAKGGGIYIKPSKRGTFTAAATKHGMGVQEFASRVLANKEDYSPAMVKKANFARNAAKWHAFGGDLMTNGATWDNGFTYVGNGGSHESNPNEGVQVGVDPQGIPNLVEEGEVIWNDYVFSKRLKVPRSFRDKYKLKDGGSLSFADAAKKFAEENKERPNDPISKRGRDALLSALMDQQEEVRLKKQQREARDQFNSLTPDEQLGIMQMAQQNTMLAGPEEEYNNMEENTMTSPSVEDRTPTMSAYGGNLFGNGGKSRFFLRDTDAQGNPIATLLEDIPEMYEGYSTTTGQTWDEVLASKGFTRVGKPQKSTVDGTDYIDYFLQRKTPTTPPATKEDTKITMPLNLQQTTTRYAPAISAGLVTLTDALGITNTPDFSSAKALEKAAERVGTPSLVRAQTIGNRLAYTPFDTTYYANRINPQTRATAENIMESAAGNSAQAMAGLLTLDRNAADQMGDLFRKAEEYNLEQRAKVADFNRATDIFNAQQALTADRANQQERRQASAAYAAGIAQAEALRQKAQQYADANRSANLTNFLQGLGDIGNENEQRNWLKTLYASGYFGNSPTMERVLYSDSDILANYMKNNPSAKVEDVVAATGINKKKVTRYFKKKGLTI